jgi:hypothetical protein
MKKVNVIHVFLYPYMKIEQRNHEYQRQFLWVCWHMDQYVSMKGNITQWTNL